jgi:hypothetical protein
MAITQARLLQDPSSICPDQVEVQAECLAIRGERVIQWESARFISRGEQLVCHHRFSSLFCVAAIDTNHHVLSGYPAGDVRQAEIAPCQSRLALRVLDILLRDRNPQVEVSCDRFETCAKCVENDLDETLHDLRQHASSAGWVVSQDDLCPSCAAAMGNSDSVADASN